MEDLDLVGKILLVVVCANIALMAVFEILGKVKDLTLSDTDNKIHAFLGKLLKALQSLIDWVSANRQHKP